jgi:hypothetical protein
LLNAEILKEAHYLAVKKNNELLGGAPKRDE